MTARRLRVLLIAACLVTTAAAGSSAQNRAQTGTLRVIVKDPSGAVIPGASVQVSRIDRALEPAAAVDQSSDGEGVATASALAPGRYMVVAAFPGFETQTIPDVRVRAGDNRREVVLAIKKIDESVAVGRDPATVASDPRNDRFSNVLSKEQIDALPDDPDDMEKVLKEMAGPGGTIRVDGFRGGKLPPKSQIRSIRFSSSMFAAENHGGGLTFVDISTAPGIGPMRGSMDFVFRDEALNARNAFQEEKRPEQTQQYTFNLSGTLLRNRTSFSLAAGGTSLYDSANILAALPDGSTKSSYLKRPGDRLNFTGRVDHALSKSHMLRGSFQQNDNDQGNLGVGGFDLSDRAFGRTVTERLLRLSEGGPWRRTVFAESRFQVRWADTEAFSSIEAPTVRVLDAFTIGGAQQAGGRGSTEIEWATNVDWARGRHAVRMGTLVEGGHYRGDSRTNYLGTYTFASLADYESGLPSTFTQRIGDPLVEFSHFQAGVFVQDDWRARKNLTLSAGLRQEFQTHMDDRINLAPRAGVTWSPFKNGKTTVRAGGGIFYDWLESEVYEQTLRVDGVRQQDLVVQNPGYPDPFVGASAEVLPTSKYALASGLSMPKRQMMNLGLAQQITPTVGVNVTVAHITGSNVLRGRNTNAPLDGVRPDPALGNLTQVESTGRTRSNQAHVALSINVPGRRTFIFANYSFIDAKNDSDGAFSLPASSYDLAAEWGPAAALPQHSASAIVNTPLPGGLRLGLSALARSGTRYNVTTGRDDNGDTVFNDRPAGVGRNSAVGKGAWDVAARVSYTFGFGERQSGADGGGPTMILRRVGGPGGGSAGDLLGGGMMGGDGADTKRIRIELFASVQNLFNTVALTGYSGVMTSPFFAQPTAAQPARRIDLGLRLGF